MLRCRYFGMYAQRILWCFIYSVYIVCCYVDCCSVTKCTVSYSVKSHNCGKNTRNVSYFIVSNFTTQSTVNFLHISPAFILDPAPRVPL